MVLQIFVLPSDFVPRRGANHRVTGGFEALGTGDTSSSDTMDIKGIVKDNEVRFLRYRQGNAYYVVRVQSESTDYRASSICAFIASELRRRQTEALPASS